MYYGQCSELCGVGHGFMPIAVRVVPPDEFEAWVAQAQATYGVDDDTSVAQR
jgi:cytochrome c oxidase subunit 2